MRPKTAVLTIVIFGIMIVIAAYLQRDEFAVGPEWALPVLLAFILPIDERSGSRGRKYLKRKIY